MASVSTRTETFTLENGTKTKEMEGMATCSMERETGISGHGRVI